MEPCDVSTRASADKVLAFYEEIFRDLAEAVHLEDRLRQAWREALPQTILRTGLSSCGY